MRPPVRPRPVVDRHLHDRAPLADQERPEEPVAAAEHRQPQRHLAREDPDRAPVSRIDWPSTALRTRLAHRLMTRFDQTSSPLHPPPQRGVVAGQGVPEHGQVGRVVLEVGVERRDPLPRRLAEARRRRRRLPHVRRQPDRPQLGVLGRQPPQDRGRLVGRAVVHHHDLEPGQPPPPGRQRPRAPGRSPRRAAAGSPPRPSPARRPTGPRPAPPRDRPLGRRPRATGPCAWTTSATPPCLAARPSRSGPPGPRPGRPLSTQRPLAPIPIASPPRSVLDRSGPRC